MEFHVLSLFPTMFNSVFGASITKKACDRDLIKILIHNLRDFTKDRHRITDDYPYGGGGGMVLKVEPIARAIEKIESERGACRKILTSPQGKTFNQSKARELAAFPRLIIICGHYEGVDDRVRQHFIDEEISIGDYILSGGEIAALAIVDAVARLIPGVVGNPASIRADSFSSYLLDYPQYTRPRDFAGSMVPGVLLSGDHEKIRNWRLTAALKRTKEERPDLLENVELTSEEEEMLKLIEEL